jgi:CRISPR-associated protein Cmr6
MKEGKLKIKNSLKGSIYISKRKEHSLPEEYVFADRSLNNVMCQFELLNGESGHVVKIIVNGQELLKNTAGTERKATKIKEQEEQEAIEREAKENEKKYAKERAEYRTDSFTISLKDREKNKVYHLCPEDTKDLNIEAFQVENFALKLKKFARFVEKDDYSKSNFEFFKTNRGNIEHQIVSNYGDTDFKALTDRNERNAKILFGENCKVFTKSTAGRLITGLGGASVYETDITLHHIYGFPYIPASAIKGICNHYAEDNNHKGSDTYVKIFGNTSNKGKIIFLDAMPKTTPQLKTDIMNPHYPDWYGSGKAPTDTQSPKPIFFLTVEETEFQFILASKEKDKGLLGTAMTWLENALKEKGIGAKTAVGYGYMS